MMEKLIRELDRNLNYARCIEDRKLRKTYFDQAYGMAYMCVMLDLATSEEISKLWDIYKGQFEELIWGC